MTDRKKWEAGTDTLLHRLFKTPSLETYINENLQTMKIPFFHEYITSLCAERGEVAERIINRAGIERTFGHQLFNGTRNPSRDKVIQLAIGFGMGVDQAQQLLRIARKNALYPKIKRDAAIIYCLNHGMTFLEAQNMLDTLNFTILGGAKKDG